MEAKDKIVFADNIESLTKAKSEGSLAFPAILSRSLKGEDDNRDNKTSATRTKTPACPPSSPISGLRCVSTQCVRFTPPRRRNQRRCIFAYHKPIARKSSPQSAPWTRSNVGCKQSTIFLNLPPRVWIQACSRPSRRVTLHDRSAAITHFSVSRYFVTRSRGFLNSTGIDAWLFGPVHPDVSHFRELEYGDRPSPGQAQRPDLRSQTRRVSTVAPFQSRAEHRLQPQTFTGH